MLFPILLTTQKVGLQKNVSSIRKVGGKSIELTHSLRLFANMTAGHIVLKVIGTFASFTLIGGIALLPALVALSALEFLVAYLQAYIFALLAAVYLADAVELHH